MNVKHTDLTAFMKIAQALQIKGLTQRPSGHGSPKGSASSGNTGGNNGSGGGNGSSGGVGCLSTATANVAAAGSEAGGSSGASNFHSNTLAGNNVIDTKINTSMFAPGGSGGSVGGSSVGHNLKSGGHALCSGPSDLSSSGSHKRSFEYPSEIGAGGSNTEVFGKKANLRRGSDGGIGFGHSGSGGGGVGGGSSSDHELHGADSMENITSNEVFMPPIPHISMDDRFDLTSVKRETMDQPILSPGLIRGLLPQSFAFEYNAAGLYGGAGSSGGNNGGGGGNSGSGLGSGASSVKNVEYPNELHMSSDFGVGRNMAGASMNHMDIPAGMYNCIIELV